jgi:hypothetical protein
MKTGDRLNFMQHLKTQGSDVLKATQRMPEVRYSYYRRCQVFRRHGEQCKAPAEKGSPICYAHAAQLAMAVRRERERRAVLMAAVAEMRKRGKPECGMADLFTDFKGIQVTTAVMAQALIDGRIDCKTAGQMAVHLQTMSKLLWMLYRKTKTLPRIDTDNTDQKKLAKSKPLPLINSDDTDLKQLPKSPKAPKIAESENPKSCATTAGCVDKSAEPRVFKLGVIAFRERSRAHGPPELKVA